MSRPLPPAGCLPTAGQSSQALCTGQGPGTPPCSSTRIRTRPGTGPQGEHPQLSHTVSPHPARWAPILMTHGLPTIIIITVTAGSCEVLLTRPAQLQYLARPPHPSSCGAGAAQHHYRGGSEGMGVKAVCGRPQRWWAPEPIPHAVCSNLLIVRSQ